MPGAKAVTDNHARAQADVEVDIITPLVAYEVAKLEMQCR
jgi:hypothetical protein